MERSELQYVLDHFEERLAALKGGRIALHGSGTYAKAVFDAFDPVFHFAAVLEGEDVPDELSLDAVILTERTGEAEQVFRKLQKTCRERGIAVFDMYGVHWSRVLPEIDSQSGRTLAEWKEITAPYDVISFEEADTFMKILPYQGKKILRPRRIFAELADWLRENGKTIIFIGRGPISMETQRQALIDWRFAKDAAETERIFFPRRGEDGGWHAIRERYPRERILHIGYGIPKECILPRYYGADTYRMTFGPAFEELVPGRGNLEFREEEPVFDPGFLKLKIRETIRECEAVSFDVFDTLVCRSTLSPEDVFALTEKEALSKGLPAEGFARIRTELLTGGVFSDGAAGPGEGDPAIGDIYRILQRRMELTEEEREELLAIELAEERRVLLRREGLCAALREAASSGKRVFLISDMYLPKDLLGGMLAELGITGYEDLLVSCDCGRRKEEGLFEELLSRGVRPEKTAHIGDSLLRDVLPAKALGMKAVRVPTVMETADREGLSEKIRGAKTLEERCALAEELVRRFADPFRNTKIEEIICGAPPEDAELYYDEKIAGTEDFSLFYHLSSLRRALLSWYPFRKCGRALEIGGGYGALTGLLLDRFEHVTVVERDAARAECIRRRYSVNGGNASVCCEDIRDFRADCVYDAVLLIDFLEEYDGALTDLFRQCAGLLAPGGVLLAGFRNRDAARYKIGALDLYVRSPGDTHRLFTRNEVEAAADGWLACRRWYYPMPDPVFTQAVYTEEFLPASGIQDRVLPFDAFGSPLTGRERDLYGDLIRRGTFGRECNYYLAEFTLPSSVPAANAEQTGACPAEAGGPEERDGTHVIHAAICADREREHAFLTRLYSDGRAEKSALYPEGRAALAEIFRNGEKLRQAGLLTVPQTLTPAGLVMPVMKEQPLLDEIREYIEAKDPGAVLAVFRELYENVFKAAGAWGLEREETGPLLGEAFIDMIPYNAFRSESGGIRYYDQEFRRENCPALYVLFRALHYTYLHFPKLEEILPSASAYEEFGMTRKMRDTFGKEEERFLSKNRNCRLFASVYRWARF